MRLKGFKYSFFLIPCDFLHAVCSYFQYLSTQVEHVPFLSPSCALSNYKIALRLWFWCRYFLFKNALILRKKSFCKHSSGNGSWRNNFGLKAAFFINKNVRGHCNESIVFLVNRIYVYASQYWMEPITKISSVTHDPLSYMCWSRIILCSALIWLFHFFDFFRAVEVLALPFCK